MLDPEHQAFSESIRKLARSQVTPVADEMDRTDEFPLHILQLFRDQGLVQLAVPDEFGGPGGDVTSICIAREEIARAGSMALATLAGQNNTLALALLQNGSEEQRHRFMPDLAQGAIALVALTEADAGSDPSRMETRAVRDGSTWVINGQKSFISWGKMARFATIFARTGDSPDSRRISAFIVDTETVGFIEARQNEKMGQRGFPNVELVFDDLRVPAENMLGDEGTGLRAGLQGIQQNRVMLAAVALGGGLAALDCAVDFLSSRQHKGRPMTDLQGLRWILADMATDLEAARALVYECASRLDAGVALDDLVGLSAMAKLTATEAAVRAANDAIQLLGGAGYMKDRPVERYLRDAKATTIYEGTTQVQKNTIARALLPT